MTRNPPSCTVVAVSEGHGSSNRHSETTEEAVVYQARQNTRTLQLEQFVETAADGVPGIERIRQDWEPGFEYLADQDAIVVLDESP
jgi:hypothetical protein